MSERRVLLRPDTYVDSVRLMAAGRAIESSPGVRRAFALMATPVNVAILTGQGFDDPALASARANDLVLAVEAATAADADAALAEGERELASEPPAGAPQPLEHPPASLAEATTILPDANLALVSVPGAFATLEAHKALSEGLHVLLFSDNVELAAEVELKRRAVELGLMVMGPGAGTAIVGGTGLGFANAVSRGPVGIVAAAGTGAQEVSTLISRWGSGVADVIGIGGRDLSESVGGLMARSAIRTLTEDPRVEAILLVSKPPAPAVAASLVAELGAKPSVVGLLGLRDELVVPEGVRVARTLEEAAALAVEIVGLPRPVPSPGLVDRVAATAGRLGPARTSVRGLYCGGTLCFEAMAVLSSRLGPVRSNTPLRAGWDLPAPPGAHVCLDLGEEEYTRGRPHPMIDPSARTEAIEEAAADPSTAVILVDVVLGYGAHPDPASVVAPICGRITAAPDGPAVVAYVLGTDGDPQGAHAQTQRLTEAGCLVGSTSARSALMAAAIATRRPELAAERP